MTSGHIGLLKQLTLLELKNRVQFPEDWCGTTNMAAVFLFWYTNMAYVSLSLNTNMAAVTSRDNALYTSRSSLKNSRPTLTFGSRKALERSYNNAPVFFQRTGKQRTGKMPFLSLQNSTTSTLENLHQKNHKITRATTLELAFLQLLK